MCVLRRRFSAENGNYFPLGRGRSDVGKRICATSREIFPIFPNVAAIFRRRSTAISNVGNWRETRPILSLFSINLMSFPIQTFEKILVFFLYRSNVNYLVMRKSILDRLKVMNFKL